MMGAILTWEGGSLVMDIVSAESGDFGSTVTEHPVERGANITDFIREDLDIVNVVWFVSNSPIGEYVSVVGGSQPGALRPGNIAVHKDGKMKGVSLVIPEYSPSLTINVAGVPVPNPGAIIATAQKAVTGLVNKIFGSEPNRTALMMTFAEDKDYATDAIALLRDLKASGKLLTLALPRMELESMTITKITPNRTSDEGTGVEIGIEFKQIRTVQVLTVAAPKPTELRAVPKVHKGVKEVVIEGDLPAQSAAVQLFGKGLGVLQ